MVRLSVDERHINDTIHGHHFDQRHNGLRIKLFVFFLQVIAAIECVLFVSSFRQNAALINREFFSLVFCKITAHAFNAR